MHFFRRRSDRALFRRRRDQHLFHRHHPSGDSSPFPWIKTFPWMKTARRTSCCFPWMKTTRRTSCCFPWLAIGEQTFRDPVAKVVAADFQAWQPKTSVDIDIVFQGSSCQSHSSRLSGMATQTSVDIDITSFEAVGRACECTQGFPLNWLCLVR